MKDHEWIRSPERSMARILNFTNVIFTNAQTHDDGFHENARTIESRPNGLHLIDVRDQTCRMRSVLEVLSESYLLLTFLCHTNILCSVPPCHSCLLHHVFCTVKQKFENLDFGVCVRVFFNQKLQFVFSWLCSVRVCPFFVIKIAIWIFVAVFCSCVSQILKPWLLVKWPKS